jgi:hypothetical protein
MSLDKVNREKAYRIVQSSPVIWLIRHLTANTKAQHKLHDNRESNGITKDAIDAIVEILEAEDSIVSKGTFLPICSHIVSCSLVQHCTSLLTL